MIRKWWGVCGAGALAVMAWACTGETTAPTPPPESGNESTARQPPPPPESSETPPAQTPPGDTNPPPSTETPPPVTESPPTETPGGETGQGNGNPLPDPWPREAVVNYTQQFGVGKPQGVAVDDAFNIWLLDGNRIGVLKPGASQPVWASDIGQAGRGFSSTVICGGAAGRAYVGYYSSDEVPPYHESYNDPSYGDGDLDAVKLTAEGTIALEEHVHRNFRRNREKGDGSLMWEPPVNVGIRNSNTWQYDEDRAVLSCVKVMRGRDKGEVYIGTNHGVTRIRGLNYNSHRHTIWMEKVQNPDGSVKEVQRAGYNYGLGIAQNGDVLIANDWQFGIVTANADLGLWDWMDKQANVMKVESSFLPEVNTQAEFDYWRGFQQTRDGRYYLASRSYGLWEMNVISAGNPYQKGTAIQGLPTQTLSALAATDDGSLFIGTNGEGLWRMDAQKTLTRVAEVEGQRVKQLIYDPNATPAMLYVLTDSGLTVLRGH